MQNEINIEIFEDHYHCDDCGSTDSTIYTLTSNMINGEFRSGTFASCYNTISGNMLAVFDQFFNALKNANIDPVLILSDLENLSNSDLIILFKSFNIELSFDYDSIDMI